MDYKLPTAKDVADALLLSYKPHKTNFKSTTRYLFDLSAFSSFKERKNVMCVAIPEKSSYDEVVAALDALFKKAASVLAASSPLMSPLSGLSTPPPRAPAWSLSGKRLQFDTTPKVAPILSSGKRLQFDTPSNTPKKKKPRCSPESPQFSISDLFGEEEPPQSPVIEPLPERPYRNQKNGICYQFFVPSPRAVLKGGNGNRLEAAAAIKKALAAIGSDISLRGDHEMVTKLRKTLMYHTTRVVYTVNRSILYAPYDPFVLASLPFNQQNIAVTTCENFYNMVARNTSKF